MTANSGANALVFAAQSVDLVPQPRQIRRHVALVLLRATATRTKQHDENELREVISCVHELVAGLVVRDLALADLLPQLSHVLARLAAITPNKQQRQDQSWDSD